MCPLVHLRFWLRGAIEGPGGGTRDVNRVAFASVEKLQLGRPSGLCSYGVVLVNDRL